MGKGYIVVTYRKIKDQAKWEAYAKLAAAARRRPAANTSCAECRRASTSSA